MPAKAKKGNESLPWFRLYSEFATDPVVQSLEFEDQRHFIVVLCLKCSGVLDRDISTQARNKVISRGLGVDSLTADSIRKRLVEVKLIDKNWQPNGWEKRQYRSDVSTERVRKSRKSKETGNVSETLRNSFGNAPDTDTDTDTELQESDPNGSDSLEPKETARKQPCNAVDLEGYRIIHVDGEELHGRRICTFPIVGEEPYGERTEPIFSLDEKTLDQYSRLYPALDVEDELLKAEAWLISNPGRRKTRRGMPRFLNNWLSRTNDSGQRRAGR